MHGSSRSGSGRMRGQRGYRGYDFDRDDSRSRDGPPPLLFNNRTKNKHHKKLERKAANLLQSLYILDSDADMGGSGGSGSGLTKGHDPRRFKQRSDRPISSGRDGGIRGRKGFPRKTVSVSPSSWYKVIVRSTLEHDNIIPALSNFIHPLQLVTFNYLVHAEEVSFMVDDHDVAEELLNADRKLTMKDNRKMGIKVRPLTPHIDLNDKLTATMKMVMASRYNEMNKALDLSKFHYHPVFLSENILCPLNRPAVMIAAIEMISESIPDLVALNLSDNRIHAVEHMKIMIEKLPRLKILHMANNKVVNVKQLDALSGLGLEELNVEGNPFCARHTTKDEYIRAIRHRFPRVIKLDGETLPPPILFDLGEDEGRIPKSQPTFICDEAGIDFAKSFLQQYYSIFDSDDRSMLIQAYHDNAQYSMHCFIPPGEPSYTMNSYIQDSRNLFKVPQLDRRIKMLMRGKHSVLEGLKSFPKTEHDSSSLSVDLVLFMPTLIQLNVMGVFKEVKSNTCKGFSRVFVIVPAGTGFCIVNDILSVFSATEKMKKSIKIKEMSQSSAPGPSSHAVASPHQNIPPLMPPPAPQASPIAIPLQPGVIDDNTKQQMVTTLSMKTGMNIMWSGKCLNETHWNFDQALYAFEELNKAGQIPPDAFQK